MNSEETWEPVVTEKITGTNFEIIEGILYECFFETDMLWKKQLLPSKYRICKVIEPKEDNR